MCLAAVFNYSSEGKGLFLHDLAVDPRVGGWIDGGFCNFHGVVRFFRI